MQIIDKSPVDVIVIDNLPPEAMAMLLALYSRDPRSVREHWKKIEEVGWGKFMAQYYVGYGHKSIGDCGSTTVCGEFVSMLAAKAIQSHRLYNGQEASTRYLDMTVMPVLNPAGTTEGHMIQSRWMALYERVLKELVPYLAEKYPMLADDDPKVYHKAVKAKAFDIARAWLPAGCLTFVGWHTNLRQAWDHLKELSFHPLAEIRDVAAKMLGALQEKYPSSFSFKSYPEQDDWLNEASKLTYNDLKWTEHFISEHRLQTIMLTHRPQLRHLLETRPVKTELPDFFERYGQMTFTFPLDFGSFRDLQRHRSCVQAMPLLTTEWDVHPWYLDQLPEGLREEVEATIDIQEKAIEEIGDLSVRQYYVAMGYRVVCEVVAGLKSAVYIAELRSTQAVHPTLRPIAQEIGHFLKSLLPFMALHCDMGPDEWTTIRGKHDIVKKES